MAKVLEEIIVIKLSKIVKDDSKTSTVVSVDQKKLIEETVPALVEEVINDNTIIVEVAELN